MIFYLLLIFYQASTSLGIDEKQWDEFVEFVLELLVNHPISQADTVMALKLGSSVYQNYDNWLAQPNNVVKPFDAKVSYLLNHWKQKNNYTSMREMIVDLNEKLKKETSFNMMREELKQRFL